ncbi:MAG: hypothetical protein LBQ64_03180, partial [Bacteroidales bacterium]|nr:hypothetical protein [Bacteroidales bacterium]
ILNALIPLLYNPYFDAIIRTFLLCGLFMLIMYFWKISEDTNSVIRNGITRFFAFFRKTHPHE